MGNFTDDPIDLEKSLASEPGGNELIKKKKKSAYLSWNELMESVICCLFESKQDNIEQDINFQYIEDDSEEHDKERGYNISQINAFIDGNLVGELKIAYIPLEKFEEIYKSIWHYLYLSKGWTSLKKIIYTDKWKDPEILWEHIYPYLRMGIGSNLSLEEKIEIIKEIQNNSIYKDDFHKFKRHWVNKPMVDFIQVNPKWRRKGIGTSLYREGARIMAQKGLKLYASGIQSPEAKAAWSKMPIETKSGRRFLSDLNESVCKTILESRFFDTEDIEENLKSIEELKALIPKFVKAAQKEYDEWMLDDDGFHWELGSGGICQNIAEQLADVLNSNGIEATIACAHQGEQHVWAVAKTSDGVFEIDIDPYRYETGGGYNWKKLPDVEFSEDDIIINLLDSDPSSFEDYLDSI